MVRKIITIRRGKQPVVVIEETQENVLRKSEFPKNSYVFVTRSYEGQLLGTVFGTNPALFVDDIGVPLTVEVQKMLRQLKESPVTRKYLEVKKVGNIITELPEMVGWDEETEEGERSINSFSFECGFFDKYEYSSNGELKKHFFYSPNGNCTIHKYEHGVVETIEEKHHTY